MGRVNDNLSYDSCAPNKTSPQPDFTQDIAGLVPNFNILGEWIEKTSGTFEWINIFKYNSTHANKAMIVNHAGRRTESDEAIKERETQPRSHWKRRGNQRKKDTAEIMRKWRPNKNEGEIKRERKQKEHEKEMVAKMAKKSEKERERESEQKKREKERQTETALHSVMIEFSIAPLIRIRIFHQYWFVGFWGKKWQANRQQSTKELKTRQKSRAKIKHMMNILPLLMSSPQLFVICLWVNTWKH